ncbi:DDT domain [Fragilaria crotonensis]|nr:DDT domain [Fragilaria crotonensis]
MADKAVADDKEVKRRKQVKKMTKILSRAWDLPNSDPFQECAKKSTAEDVFDLASLGENLDTGIYKYGRSGWEKFARDIGGVYNRHIERKTKFAPIARTHRNEVCDMLGKIDESLAKQATQHCPFGDDSKKRKSNSVDDTNRRPSKKADTKNGADMTVVEREAKAMSDLANYIEEVGGRRSQLAAFSSRVTKKSDGRYDVNFFCDNRRYRSMVEVARFLNLAAQKDQTGKVGHQ